MSDLSKLMEKIEQQKADKTQEEDNVKEVEEVVEEKVDDFADEEDDVEEEVEKSPVAKEETQKPATPKKSDNQEVSVDQEIALLQNSAIYRREMLMVQKERNDILTAIAEILLNGNKKK